ncbi:queuine tRNA-ribosyltransferase accessory subunit 2-like isoform X2 [Acanthaster planci]|uniref:Queuine tRNA-ribosyltransferase accessory subunit 2 n=1 Tax=Acanthaster planci TaxID=133434 RepID=A0A8B7ZPU6_ACAPL|nr:queuine tRNA-ribosyltransferase accessory subunit 2-like isoform X2 [Acanthaster planci]
MNQKRLSWVTRRKTKWRLSTDSEDCNIKMKFQLHKIQQAAGRLATLSELGRRGNVSMETPDCMLYTRCGSAPHLSHALLGGIDGVPAVTHIPLPTIVESVEILEAFGQGVAAFTGRPDAVVCTSTQDPRESTPTGYNDKNSVSVWASGGRRKLTVEGFLDLQEALQPDWMEALADGDTPVSSSTKRVKKSVDRTLEFLDQCLDAQRRRQKLRDIDVFGVIEGGELLEERLRSACETAKRPVAGFVLDGFHEESMDDRARWGIMKAVLDEIPEDKPRCLPRVGRPDEVLDAVELGVDIFDSVFPYDVTERGCALVFSFMPVPSAQNDDIVSRPAPDGPVSGAVADRGGGTTCDLERQGGNGDLNGRTVYEMNLSDQRYVDDFTAVVVGCQCYCCINHTRAYINHLINAKELLARVLLMIHNFHHYFRFFRSIRKALQDGTLQELKAEINNCR